MERMTTLGDYMRFLARQPEAEAKRFETDGTLLFVIGRLVRGYHWNGSGRHWNEKRGDADVDK